MRTAVVAHISRQHMAQHLADTIQADHISFDDGSLGSAEANHQAVWQWHLENPADWAVTLEDDCEPVDDFRSQAAAALNTAPTPIVSLYLGRQRPPGIQRRISSRLKSINPDCCWLTHPKLLHAVAYAIKSDLIASLLQHRTGLPVDEHITDWARKHQHPISYTVPSLVDHADTPTVIQRHHDNHPRPPGRRAWQTGTRQQWTPQAQPL